MCEHPDSIFDEARRGIIIARLRDGLTVEQIKLACDGCSQDSFSQGENKDGKKYDGIMRICKKAESKSGTVTATFTKGRKKWKSTES